MTISLASALPLPRFKRRRDIGLLAIVVAVAAVWLFHRPASHAAGASQDASGWFGELTWSKSGDIAAAEPLSSSSLVVPSTTLALPAVAKTPLQLKKACDSADVACAIRPLPVLAQTKRLTLAESAIHPLPPRRSTEPAKPMTAVSEARAPDKGFSLNPLDHLPDTKTLGRPFAAAGTTISGWMKRL